MGRGSPSMTATASIEPDANSPSGAARDDPPSKPPRARGRTRSGLARGVVAITGLAVALALALVAHALRPRPELPSFGMVPSFRLVDELGRPFTSDAMRGHVTIADFIFTRCSSSCPRLTARMYDLQSRLVEMKSRAKLVSFSVDPENDTPSVLSDYAARAHADTARWSFVTGPADDIERTVVFGFKMSAAKVARGAGDYDVTHGDWFVLIDSRGEMRGYYTADGPEDIDLLLGDILRLERIK
jgi:protein SCO1/2